MNVNPLTGTVTDDLFNAFSYFIGQCTRFVAGALSWIPPGLGNAYQWLGNAQAQGFTTIGPTLSPPTGSVAVWGPSLPGSGGFGHVAEVIGSAGGGFTVAEENFLRGPGATDVRAVTNLSDLTGFILPPGTSAGQTLGQNVGAGLGGVGSIAKALSDLPANSTKAAADFLTAGANNVDVFMQRQIVALAVAAVVLLVLFLG